ncbi:MAG: PD-(D/E)XK motif protein [Candidatus Jettenia caeni]|nr:MAG: PD-(D/E)XK motif protein [Candidatus Jettenia caeni]
MSRITSDVWMYLEQVRPSGDNLTARPAVSGTGTRLQCAIDSGGYRHFLIALHSGEQVLRDTQSRGLSVVTRDLIVRGEPAAQYLDIQCLDTAGHGAFDLIGGELITELSRAGSNPAESAKRVLARWRRFWGQLPRTLLTREEMLGMFAELWFLFVWLHPAVGLAEAVRRWRGPFGSRHDFEWAGKSVEVKATTSPRGHIHRINGIGQLLPPEEGELLFFSMHLGEEANATNTLPTLVNTILQYLNSDIDALSRFETALVQTGYSPAHNEEYSKLHLRVIGEGLFSVRDNFPRITVHQFHTGVPAGVERIEYEINLGTFDCLRIARMPQEGLIFIQ